jgi:3-hydroxy-9,10-secoandrosta-1,3,5(10)-triene-9,17-dione monooxygenase reductase component
MKIDPIALRNALGQYATGVAVVTTLDQEGRPTGLTINSFASVSLNPPLVLWSLALTSACLPAFDACEYFAVNVLTAEQVAISNRFASAGAGAEKFADVEWSAGLGGVPVLKGTGAVFECRSEARHPGGDHHIYIGRVERFAHGEVAPLIFHAGRYCARAELPPHPAKH